MAISVVTPRELADLSGLGKINLIDVRTPVEFREVHAENARNVALDALDLVAVMQARNGAKDEPLYTICRSESRMQQACGQACRKRSS